MSKATIRSWRSRGAAWLPEPVGRLDGFVWREEDLRDIEKLMPEGPGRPSGDRARKVPPTAQRARGAYYTPQDAAHFLASWALRGSDETFLEPSFGDGSFIRAVADVAHLRGTRPPTWVAAELDPESARAVVQQGLLSEQELRLGDFLGIDPEPVDAVIANPPYVRLRHLPESSRALALARTAEAMGESMHPSGSIWMPFVTHMLSFLRSGGRAGLVLPLDFTYVAYARPLWGYLAQNFDALRVIRTRQRIFSDINQDVMVLLADGFGGATKHLEYEAYETAEALAGQARPKGGRIRLADLSSGERAFQIALLPNGLADLLAEVSPRTRIASDLMTFRIGYIAGDKTYFHPAPDVVEKYTLPSSSLHPAVINSRRLRGRGLRTMEMDPGAADRLWVPSEHLSEGELQYVKAGAERGVSQGYKAQMRKPWYRVPGVKAPDVILSVFSERPLLLINDARWLASNSLLCGYVKEGAAEQFVAAWYSPLTLLSIGLQVHSLGGGVMVMVPNEASRIQMPRVGPETAVSATTKQALQVGDMQAAYAGGDKLTQELVGKDGLALIYEGIHQLAHWRTR
ncbi:N-6 DNA methylase [Frigoribacterium sp. VKM Ac-1396]|nr:N-6 DNA methylase [Frigoribacterium sp. VKM Ac-1396]